MAVRNAVRLIAGIDVQAYDRFELAGDVLVFALPIAATGLTVGFKDGEGSDVGVRFPGAP